MGIHYFIVAIINRVIKWKFQYPDLFPLLFLPEEAILDCALLESLIY